MTIRTNTTSIYAPLARRRTGVLGLVSAVDALWRQRKALSELAPHLLKDIGISAKLARNEADRPFWDIPSHWNG